MTFGDPPTIEIIVCKPKDIPMLLQYGKIDAVLCYSDRVLNAVEVIPVASFQSKATRISVVAKGEFDITQPIEGRKLEIAAEYPELAAEWARRHGYDLKITQVFGSAESYVAMDVVDMAVVVVDTGATLRDNGLVEMETILDNELAVFVPPNRANELRRYFSVTLN